MSEYVTRFSALALCLFGIPSVVTAQWTGRGYFGMPPFCPTPVPVASGDSEPTPPPPTTAILNDVEKKIFAELDKKKDWNLGPMTIERLAAKLNERLSCRVDERAFEDVGLSPAYPRDDFRGDQFLCNAFGVR